jgi:predicted membrane protein
MALRNQTISNFVSLGICAILGIPQFPSSVLLKEGDVNKAQLIVGVFLILLGLTLLFEAVLDIQIWAYIWPLVLIGLGVWLLLRPHLPNSDVLVRQKLLGDIHRRGLWQVTDEEIWSWVGSVDLDMVRAGIPSGETQIRIFSFIGDVSMRVPADVGVAVSANGLVTEIRVLGHREDRVLAPFEIASPNYETAESKIRLEMFNFVGTLRVNQLEVSGPEVLG